METNDYKKGYDQACIDFSYNIKRGLKDEKIRESFSKELNDLIDEIKDICYENEIPPIEEAFEKDEVYFESSIIDEDLTMYFNLPSKYLPKKFDDAAQMSVSIAIPLDEMLLSRNADCMYGAVDSNGHTIDWLNWNIPYEVIDKFIDVFLSNNVEYAISSDSLTFEREETDEEFINLYFKVPYNYLPKEVLSDNDMEGLKSIIRLVINKDSEIITDNVIKSSYREEYSNEWTDIEFNDYVIGQLLILYKESILKESFKKDDNLNELSKKGVTKEEFIDSVVSIGTKPISKD